MSNELDELSDVNKKHRQKILLLKSRTQNMFKRSNPIKSITNDNAQHKQKQLSALQFLKEYQSNQSSQPQHEYSSIARDNKSFNFNSTLFKNIRQQSHIAQKHEQFVNNESRVSSVSSNTRALQTNQLFKDSSLLNKIDELLLGRKKQLEKQRIRNIYDEYLEKKSNSSQSTPNNSDLHAFTTLKINKQQKNKLTEVTVKKQKQQFKNQKPTQKVQTSSDIIINSQPKKQKNLPPKSPLLSVNTIERQKKKLQQTMKVIKKQQQSSDFHDKSSLLLELSDESEIEDNKSEIKLEDIKNTNKQQLFALKQQKGKVLNELKLLELELEKLERQQQQDQ